MMPQGVVDRPLSAVVDLEKATRCRSLTVRLRVPGEVDWDRVPPCGECSGELLVADVDGSVTGSVGSVVPCLCVLLDEEESERRPGCGCFFGWVKTTPEEWRKDPECPSLRPCGVHRAVGVGSVPVEVDGSGAGGAGPVSRCFGCGTDSGFRYVLAEGVMVLTHEGGQVCPSGQAFALATGERVTVTAELAKGVAA